MKLKIFALKYLGWTRNATANGWWSKWYLVLLFYIDRRILFDIGLRMTSPGARMPSNPIGHPGGSLPNAYRPQGMSPSINQSGPRMYMTNSPGVRKI